MFTKIKLVHIVSLIFSLKIINNFVKLIKHYQLNLEFFIARRFLTKNKKNISQPIIRVAIGGIALGIAVMIVSVAIVTGFQQKITNKVIGFGGHIQIGKFDLNQTFESNPIIKNDTLEKGLMNIAGVINVQVFAHKAGIIKTDSQIQGFVLKGIGSDYDWKFMKENLIEGSVIDIKDTVKTNDVLVSKYLADKLKLKLNDKLRTYFISDKQLRARAFNIKGIYETGLEEFDKKFVYADIAHIQKLNNWSPLQVEGYEILINNFKEIDNISNEVYSNIDNSLNSKTIKELHPEIFSWLNLTDMNVVVIIVILSLISAVTMISTLLIIILEKTNTIGTLKALGAQNITVRRIFIYQAVYITFRGLLWGNLIAFIICFIQFRFGLFKLDQSQYYVPVVPINFSIIPILLINAGAIVLCVLSLIIPSYIITKITPVKAIRFN